MDKLLMYRIEYNPYKSGNNDKANELREVSLEEKNSF